MTGAEVCLRAIRHTIPLGPDISAPRVRGECFWRKGPHLLWRFIQRAAAAAEATMQVCVHSKLRRFRTELSGHLEYPTPKHVGKVN